MFGRWNTPIALGAFILGFFVAGRRMKVIMLTVLGFMFVFIFGTQTGIDGWTLTIWSWLAIIGSLVALCFAPRAMRLDRHDKAEHRFERRVERAEEEMVVQAIAAERLGDHAEVIEATERPHATYRPVQYEEVTDNGVVVRDRRVLDPDEI